MGRDIYKKILIATDGLENGAQAIVGWRLQG